MSPRSDDLDLLVLGGGAAGFYCALSGAREGFRTALVEKASLGGTAFRSGCLPVKMALDRVKALSFGERAPRDLLHSVSRCLDSIPGHMGRQLQEAGVEVLPGTGSFAGERSFRLEARELHARHVVIATGTSPAGPPGLPVDGRTVISHEHLFAGGELPDRLVIVGADVEGAELAALLAAVGCSVTLVDQEGELLPGLDRDLTGPVEEELRGRGVAVRLGAPVAGVQPSRSGAAVQLVSGGSLECGRVLVTGVRRANIPAGLEGTEVKWEPGRIRVAPSLATDAPGIYAIGDVNGLLCMGHAAIQQGILLPRSLRTGGPLRRRWQAYRRPPRAIFTIPEIGGAGFTERELQAAGIPYRATRAALEETWRGFSLTGGTPGTGWPAGKGFLKLLASPRGEILGIWVVSAAAGEASALFGLLIERGLTVSELAESLITHPTLAEALREAALRAAAGV